MGVPNLALTGKPAAGALLAADPNALLLGMVLDQRVPQTWSLEARCTS